MDRGIRLSNKKGRGTAGNQKERKFHSSKRLSELKTMRFTSARRNCRARIQNPKGGNNHHGARPLSVSWPLRLKETAFRPQQKIRMGT